MAITYSFSDNVTYGTDDINNITKRLTGAGIAPFQSKESHSVSQLNVLTEALVSEGVQLGGCLCTMETAEGENRISVAPGIVYFPNGVVLEVDSNGHSLTIEANVSGEVYAHFDTGLQTADIVFSDVIPQEGYSVHLARVEGDNTIRDVREFARSKVATLGRNLMLNFTMERCPLQEHNGRYILQKLSGVDLSKFNYAIMTTNDRRDEENIKFFPEIGYHGAFFDLVQGKKTLGYTNNGDDLYLETGSWFYRAVAGNGYGYYYIEIISGELCVTCKYADKDSVGLGGALGCTVCLL